MTEVRKQYVEKALDEIDKGGALGVPSRRRQKTYCLLPEGRQGRHYPPKYVVMRAHMLQTGRKPEGLRGGPASNGPLEKLGYTIKEHPGCGGTCNFSN